MPTELLSEKFPASRKKAAQPFCAHSPGDKEGTLFLSVAWKVFANPRRYGFMSEDEVSEVFTRYARRLKSIICRSETLEEKKDAYLDTCLRFLAKTIQRVQRKKDILDRIVECVEEGEGDYCVSPRQLRCFASEARESGEERGARDEEKQFIGNIAPSCFIARMGASDKRLLFLAVKCAWEMDDAMAEKVARRLGLPLFWLSSLLHAARTSLEPSRLQLARLCERANAQWVRLRFLESELRGETVTALRRDRLLKSAVFCRSRYESLLARKSRCRLLVSNRKIAELLRVPKGSVDSGLFYLKESQKAKLEYSAAGGLFSVHGYCDSEFQRPQNIGAGPSFPLPPPDKPRQPRSCGA